jgi:hypothetical protein
MTDDLTRRLEAVERAVTDGHTDLAGVADDAAVADRLAAVERRLDDVETRRRRRSAATSAASTASRRTSNAVPTSRWRRPRPSRRPSSTATTDHWPTRARRDHRPTTTGRDRPTAVTGLR